MCSCDQLKEVSITNGLLLAPVCFTRNRAFVSCETLRFLFCFVRNMLFLNLILSEKRFTVL